MKQNRKINKTQNNSSKRKIANNQRKWNSLGELKCNHKKVSNTNQMHGNAKCTGAPNHNLRLAANC